MRKKQRRKQCWEMTKEELAAATAEFEREFVAETFSPLSAEERTQWENAKKKLPNVQRRRADDD